MVAVVNLIIAGFEPDICNFGKLGPQFWGKDRTIFVKSNVSS